jgi:hypothetical protein
MVACQATHKGSIPLETQIKGWGQVQLLGVFDRKISPCHSSLAEQIAFVCKSFMQKIAKNNMQEKRE